MNINPLRDLANTSEKKKAWSFTDPSHKGEGSKVNRRAHFGREMVWDSFGIRGLGRSCLRSRGGKGGRGVYTARHLSIVGRHSVRCVGVDDGPLSSANC